ncbi:MAG: NERD domain-containing protein [Sulfuricella sp.]|nr:NERD domain-containing protein [Sulfuricella sp.]
MVIKPADSKERDLAQLNALLARPDIEPAPRKRIEREIRTMAAGIKGEKEAAYEMEFHFGNSRNWMIIHDLRIQYKGRAAQIDHLLINRVLEIYVCESKHFSEGIAINDLGECTAFWNNTPYGVSSPIEQNRKHMLVLQSVLDDGWVKLPSRLGFTLKPTLKGLVLVSKKARITRPEGTLADIDTIIKIDQLKSRIDQDADNESSFGNIGSLAKVISPETLEALAQRIAALHQPIAFDWEGKFGISKAVAQKHSPTPVPKVAVTQASPSASTAVEEEKPKSKLLCHACGEKVSYTVAKFCWFNKGRFGGDVFCMDCQKAVS